MNDVQNALTQHYDQLQSAVNGLLREYNIPASVHSIRFTEHPILADGVADEAGNIVGLAPAHHLDCETECKRNSDGQWECRCKRPN